MANYPLSVHNGRFCPNRACTVIVFRKVIVNQCPKCETPGEVIHKLSIDTKGSK